MIETSPLSDEEKTSLEISEEAAEIYATFTEEERALINDFLNEGIGWIRKKTSPLFKKPGVGFHNRLRRYLQLQNMMITQHHALSLGSILVESTKLYQNSLDRNDNKIALDCLKFIANLKGFEKQSALPSAQGMQIFLNTEGTNGKQSNSGNAIEIYKPKYDSSHEDSPGITSYEPGSRSEY